MNAKLEAIGQLAAEDLPCLIKEGAEGIMEAWAVCAEESALNDTNPKLTLSYSIRIDLKGKVENSLSFGIKRRLSVDHDMPQPDQPELAGVTAERKN